MKLNLPVTQTEVLLQPGSYLVSKTDLKGRLVYANPAFVAISGFSTAELLGASHNIVRHPDMPPEAFQDLWGTIQAGQPWRGIVKNRCKNGDHYWVEAYITPISTGNEVVGYMSVRSAPTREQVDAADRLYAAVRAKTAQVPASATRRPPLFRIIAGGQFASATLFVLMALASNGVLPAWIAAPAGAVGAVIAVGIYVALRRFLLSGLRQMERACLEMGEGNLNNRVDVRGCLEVGGVLTRLESMRISLRAIIADVVAAADSVNNQSRTLEEQSCQLAKRSRCHAEGASGVAAALEELSVSVEEIADSTSASSRHAADAQQMIIASNQEIGESIGAVRAIIGSVSSAQTTIGSLIASIGQVDSITNAIKTLAGQTNLLALNASIEAARAGEHGRGFAVVADEVRKLADDTSHNTEAIQQTIAAIKAEAAAVADTMHQMAREVESSTSAASSGNANLQRIVHATESVAQLTKDIANMLTQQSAASADVATKMEGMNALSDENMASIAEAERSSSQLSTTAESLHLLVRHFRQSA